MVGDRRMDGPRQETLEGWVTTAGQRQDPTLTAVVMAFDPARLTQARRLVDLSKTALARLLGVSGVAVGQWEAGTHPPRPDHVGLLSEHLKVPPAFLAAGRPYARLESSAAHFRSLRKTPAHQRAKAIAFVEQVWELVYALEKRVQLPPVDLPGFSAGEVCPGVVSTDPIQAAQALRKAWGLGTAPIPRMVRLLEAHGLIVTLVPFAGTATATVSAFSTSQLPRPIVVLTPDRADDVYRHRFTAAHEVAHLLLHGDCVPGDIIQEKEADSFAAEFLTPGEVIRRELPPRSISRRSRSSVRSGGSQSNHSSTAAGRLARYSRPRLPPGVPAPGPSRKLGLFAPEPVAGYPGEVPVLITRAFELAESNGLTMTALARELASATTTALAPPGRRRG